MKKKIYTFIMIILLIAVISETFYIVTYLNREEPVETISDDPGYSAWETWHALDSGYRIPCIRVHIKDNQELEDKVNESLVKYFSILKEPFIGESATEALPPIIHLQSSRYLSVEYSFKYLKQFINEDSTYWHLCVTIDMQSGEVVFLDDILDLNDDFYKHIKYDRILKINGNDCITGQILNDWTVQEVIENINDYVYELYDLETIKLYCDDFTRAYLYGDYYRENGYDMFEWNTTLYQTYFYLDEDYIYFSELAGQSNVYIKYKDLEGYLKTEICQ